MAPREANNPYLDQYLTVEYDATAMMMPHDTGAAIENDTGVAAEDTGTINLPMVPPAPVGDTTAEAMAAAAMNPANIADEASVDDEEDDDEDADEQSVEDDSDENNNVPSPPIELHLPMNHPVPMALSGDTTVPRTQHHHNHQRRANWNIAQRNRHTNPPGHRHRSHHDNPRQQQHRALMSIGNDANQNDIDPLAIDTTDGEEEEENWNTTHAMIVEAAMASTYANNHCSVSTTNSTSPTSNRVRSRTFPSIASRASRQLSSDSTPSTHRHRRSNTSGSISGGLVSPSPGGTNNNNNNTNNNHHVISSSSQRRRRQYHRVHRGSLTSVLDQDPSISDDEDQANEEGGNQGSSGEVPDLDTTIDTSTATSETSSAPTTPQGQTNWDFAGDSQASTPVISGTTGQQPARLRLSPVRRMMARNYSNQQTTNQINVVTDEENSSSTPSSFNLDDIASVPEGLSDLDLPPSPRRYALSSSLLQPISGSTVRSVSNASTTSGRSIRWTTAFLSDNMSDVSSTGNSTSSSSLGGNPTSPHQARNQINFSFGANTNVADLKYFAERGCIVHLLRALDTPRLKTVGTRMLADYAKMPHRRVAVASNKRILEFCCRTMLEMPTEDSMGTEWPAREYAVETIRSLTATEDSDSFLMGCTGLLKTLAIVVRGGPFYDHTNLPHNTSAYRCDTTVHKGLVSGKARLHACIAIMNLSCGKANKIEIASIPEVLESMRDIMIATPQNFSPATSSPPVPNSNSSTASPRGVSEEARLKAATCIKNLSNADANDASLLGAQGLVESLAHAAVTTCTEQSGATHCTTNACLALMNLSISKANKHKVFKTNGVMNALMSVLARTSPTDKRSQSSSNNEARVKACSALSNLAIGYENKIPMFLYDGFVDAILQVIETDTGEARTKACSILWSFAAEMKNQVPVVQRGDILPALVRVAEEDHSTEARFKCVAALTLLAESLENAMPLLHSGALHPLMDILHEAGADPTQWKGQTASWCVGFLMNMAQSDDAAPFLREAGVVELLAPLLTLDHYQSLKAAMAVTFICRFDKDDETYILLRKTENVIPKIISLLHNTLSGRGGNGYKYGVFTLRSSVGCISSLASGPEFMKERIATKAVFDSLLQVITDFCVNGGTRGAIVGGGRDDALSATLAIRALQSLIEYMIPIPGSSALPFGVEMDKKLIVALESFYTCSQTEINHDRRDLAEDGLDRINKSLGLDQGNEDNDSGSEGFGFMPRRTVATNIIENSIVGSLLQGCCIGPSPDTGDDGGFFPSMIRRPYYSQPSHAAEVIDISDGNDSSEGSSVGSQESFGTFLLPESRTGRLFAVPKDPSGGRSFNDGRRWCYRRGRYCRGGEAPDPNFVWTDEMQAAYGEALQTRSSSSQGSRNLSRGSSIHGAQPVVQTIFK